MTGSGGPAFTGRNVDHVTVTSAVTSSTTEPPRTPDPTQGGDAPQPEPQPAPEPEPAPQPAPQPAPEASGPQLGDQCIGADIGRTAVAADGTAIMCDNYVWQLNQGQTPSHPWVDGQREWSECLESFTTEECREMLNP